MVSDITGLPISNASLLDEGTAAAEAMRMCYSHKNRKRHTFFIDENCHPQTIACVQTRAEAFNINIKIGDALTCDFEQHKNDLAGVLVQVCCCIKFDFNRRSTGLVILLFTRNYILI